MQKVERTLVSDIGISLVISIGILFIFIVVNLFIQYKNLLFEKGYYLFDTEIDAFVYGSIAQIVAVYIALTYSVLSSLNVSGIIFLQLASIIYLIVLQNKKTDGIACEFSDISGAVLFVNITGHYWIPLIIYSVIFAYNSYYQKYASEDCQYHQYQEKKILSIINLAETFITIIIIDFATPVELKSIIYFHTFLIIVFYIILPHCNKVIKKFIISNLV